MTWHTNIIHNHPAENKLKQFYKLKSSNKLVQNGQMSTVVSDDEGNENFNTQVSIVKSLLQTIVVVLGTIGTNLKLKYNIPNITDLNLYFFIFRNFFRVIGPFPFFFKIYLKYWSVIMKKTKRG